MVRGTKAKHTTKQKRQSEHVAEGFIERGAGRRAAKARSRYSGTRMAHGARKAGGRRSGRGASKAPPRKGRRTP